MKRQGWLAVFPVVGVLIWLFYNLLPTPPLVTPKSEKRVSPSAFPSQTPIPTPTPAPLLETILMDVPFTSQAPLGEWADPLQQDGCEEAASLMAVYWARGKSIGSKEQAKEELVAIAKWQKTHYQSAKDTSAKDTMERILKEYFVFDKVELETPTSIELVIDRLREGRVVLVPTNGRELGNPNYTGVGPERHMLVLRGFDPTTGEIITNDPGTRKGEGYRYPKEIVWQAMRDYPTGEHVPITQEKKEMIVVTSER